MNEYIKRIRALRTGIGDNYDQTIDELLRRHGEEQWLKGDWVDNVQALLNTKEIVGRRPGRLIAWNVGALEQVFDIVLPFAPGSDAASYAGPRRRSAAKARVKP